MTTKAPMKRISFISARNVNNPGMIAVDLSAQFILRRLRSPNAFRYLSFGAFPDIKTFKNGMKLQHHPLHQYGGECYKDDAIVLWGDFLLAQSYWRRDLSDIALRRGIKPESQEAMNEIAKLIAFENAPDSIWPKIISYGSTLLGDEAVTRLSNPIHARASQNFIRRCRMIWSRDPYSAQHLASLRNDYLQSYLGTDCALLMRPADLAEIADPDAAIPTQSYACIHFERTPCPPEHLFHVARHHCQSNSLQPIWLPWLGVSKNLPIYNQILPELDINDRNTGYAHLIAQLRGAKLVITDTYHLCLHAWNLGIPTICIGYGAQHPNWSLSDKKKKVFHYLYAANSFYIFAESLREEKPRENILQQQNQLLKNPQLINSIHNSVRQHAEGCSQIIVNQLRQILQVESNTI